MMHIPLRALVAAGALSGATMLAAAPAEARTFVSIGVGVPVYGGYYAPPVAGGYGYGPYWGGRYGPYWGGGYRPYYGRPYWRRPYGWRRGWYGRLYGWRSW